MTENLTFGLEIKRQLHGSRLVWKARPPTIGLVRWFFHKWFYVTFSYESAPNAASNGVGVLMNHSAIICFDFWSGFYPQTGVNFIRQMVLQHDPSCRRLIILGWSRISARNGMLLKEMGACL